MALNVSSVNHTDNGWLTNIEAGVFFSAMMRLRDLQAGLKSQPIEVEERLRKLHGIEL